jgi:hypothetical protein
MAHRATEQQELESRLTAYAATAESAGRAVDWNSRLGRWSIYAAATGAALASATSADASTIVTGFSGVFVTNHRSHATCGCPEYARVALQTHPTLSATNTVASFSLLAAYRFNLVLGYKAAAVGVTYAFPLQVSRAMAFDRTSFSALRLFATGQPIGSPSYAGLGGPVAAYYQTGSSAPHRLSQMASGTAGIFGFQMANGDIGWITLIWSSSEPDGLPDTIQARDWAINTTPGQGIYAGTDQAVPEPGTLPLSLLALGAAGIAAWRKRRHASAASAS